MFYPILGGASRQRVAELLIEKGCDVTRVWRARFCFTRHRSANQVALYKLAMRACYPLNINKPSLEELLQKILFVGCADAIMVFYVTFPQYHVRKIIDMLTNNNGQWRSRDQASTNECATCKKEGRVLPARCMQMSKDNVLHWLKQKLNQPMTLKAFCRKRIRKCLSRNVISLVKRVDISEELQDYVTLQTCDTYL